MSAIAFYDSGRLLPLRHELKQKQIEQRNLDAENTRRYIGLAGRGFANMAERTGTVFGARLGSAPTDAKGAEVDRPYGGGTIGAKASKAEWQKGTMDSESKRREVSHRLGLLMKHVEFGNADRKRRAWGNRDDAALQSEFNNRFTIFSKHAEDTSIQREELIAKWPDFFTSDAKEQLKVIMSDKDGKTEKQKQLALESFRNDPKYAPIMNFMKYAGEQGWYNSKVMEEDFEGLTMLTNYLQQEVGFTGMNMYKEKRPKDYTEQESPSETELAENAAAAALKIKNERKKKVTTTGDVDVLGNIELGHASDTTLARSASGVVTIEGNIITTVGTENIWVPAAAMTPRDNAGCAALATVAAGTSGRPDFHVLDFTHTGADEHAQFTIAMPKSWDGGNVYYYVYWIGLAATTGVTWGLEVLSLNDNEEFAQAYVNPILVDDDSQGDVTELLVSAKSAAIACSGADNDLLCFQVYRDVSAGNDDMDADARLWGLLLEYTTNAATDA